MSLTLQMLINNGLLEELADSFTEAADVNILLTSIGFPKAHRLNFNRVGSPIDFWYDVCEKIEKGLIMSSFEELLAAAAQRLQGNKTFAPFTHLSTVSSDSYGPPLTGNEVYPVSVIRHFDVFISYSRKDQDIVKCIAGKLRDRNVKVWLDEWELPKGMQFVPEIERVLAVVPAIVVFYDSQGFGPWQQTEVYSVYDRAFRSKCRLIPAMLPGVAAGDLPPFLKTFNSVAINDCSDDTAIVRLASSIKGKILRTL
jgi:hypothetical protein